MRLHSKGRPWAVGAFLTLALAGPGAAEPGTGSEDLATPHPLPSLPITAPQLGAPAPTTSAASNEPELLGPLPPPIGMGEVPSGASSTQTMRVSHFTLVDNTLLPDPAVRRLLEPYEGKDLTIGQLKDLARDVTTLYQRKGFFLVRAIVPVQDFANNTVRIQIVEGKIGKISVEGARHYSPDFILRRFKVAFPDGNFRNDKFQRAMLLLNELPDLKVKAILRPGQEVGTADVILKVEDKAPFHVGYDYNNYGTQATGVNRVGLNVEGGNLLTQADQLSVRGVVGFPSKKNTFVQAQYQVPVNLDGTTVSGSYANGAFAVSQGLGAILDVRGDADIFTVGVSHPLDRDLDFASNLGLAVSHKDIRNNFFGGQFPFSHDEYSTARLTYQADWRGSSGRTIFQGAFTQGLGGTSSSDPLISRAGASGSFSKLNLDFGRIQNLDTGLYAVLRGSVQVAAQPLYVAEQFALGGPDTVRGFSQAEILGDNAYLVSAELRWSPIKDALDAFQVALFIDHGGVSLKRRLPGDLPFGDTLTGAGFGFRFGIGDNATLRLDLGWPISPSENRGGGIPAVYTGVQTRF